MSNSESRIVKADSDKLVELVGAYVASQEELARWEMVRVFKGNTRATEERITDLKESIKETRLDYLKHLVSMRDRNE